MKTFWIPLALSIIALGCSVFALTHEQQIKQSFGATSNAGANALFEQSLAQPLGTTDANMYVTSGADVQGNLLPLNSYECLSVDTGQPNFEAICGNVTASGITGLTLAVTLRGLSTQTATTSNSSFIFTHRRGADVRITDFPTLTVVNNELNGVQNIPNPVFYSSNFTPSFWTGTASNTLATIGIVNSTAAAGCGNSSEVFNGCVQLATAAQAAAGTSIGSTGARLVPPNSLFNATPAASILVPVTSAAGKLAQGFIDLTQAFIWSGLHTFTAGFISTASSTLSATTTIAASNVLSNALILHGIPYAFPSSQGGANTFAKNDGLGNISWGTPAVLQYTVVNSNSITANGSGVNYATSTVPVTIPAGTLTASSTWTLSANITCTTSTSDCIYLLRDSGGTTFATCDLGNNSQSNNIGFINMQGSNQSSLSSQSTLVQGWTSSGAGASNTTFRCQAISTAAFNTANAINLVMVAEQTASSQNTTITGYSLTIHP